jgi:AraC family transcriptional regulator
MLEFTASHLDEDLSLRALAAKAGLSPFHLHRLFSAEAGETAKQFALRLRLDRAAVMLIQSREPIVEIALANGFQSHEVFSRTFRRRFGMSPSAYRAQGFRLQIDPEDVETHGAVVRNTGPCLGLFHRGDRTSTDRPLRGKQMEYSITTKEMTAQPVLQIRRRVKPDELAKALAEMFGEIFLFAQQTGTALAGQPLTRYVEWGPGLLTIEGAMPIAAPFAGRDGTSATVHGGMLPGGLVATAIHTGPYDKLIGAHAAIQLWIEEQGLVARGGPWELYVTDPADYPDPKDWKTEIFWPVEARKQ